VKKRNIRLTIQYDGTHYAGWQFQKNAASIQETIEDALKRIFGLRIALTGSGRTDSGVHARAQVANFKVRSELPLKRILMALNNRLPKDIVVCDVREALPGFNSRHDAKSKLYRYTIANTNFVDPFIRRYACKCFYKLDLPRMKRAASFLVGRHDFRSFQTKDGEERDSVRTVRGSVLKRRTDRSILISRPTDFCITWPVISSGH
jgi:tRNA pseudouridine38-40 synthase